MAEGRRRQSLKGRGAVTESRKTTLELREATRSSSGIGEAVRHLREAAELDRQPRPRPRGRQWQEAE